MSAKIVLTDKDYADIESWAAYCTKEQIADELSLCEKTLHNIFKRDEKALTAYKKGRAEGKRMVGSSIYKKAMAGDMAAAIFYAKTQIGWKEPKDDEGKGVNVNVSYSLPDNGRVKVEVKEDE